MSRTGIGSRIVYIFHARGDDVSSLVSSTGWPGACHGLLICCFFIVLLIVMVVWRFYIGSGITSKCFSLIWQFTEWLFCFIGPDFDVISFSAVHRKWRVCVQFNSASSKNRRSEWFMFCVLEERIAIADHLPFTIQAKLRCGCHTFRSNRVPSTARENQRAEVGKIFKKWKNWVWSRFRIIIS